MTRLVSLGFLATHYQIDNALMMELRAIFRALKCTPGRSVLPILVG